MSAALQRALSPVLKALKVLLSARFSTCLCSHAISQSEASPLTLSRSVATGVVLGCCPAPVIPMVLSAVAVKRLRLNAAVVAPTQLAVGAVAWLPLLILLARFGALLLGERSDASIVVATDAMRLGVAQAAVVLSQVFKHAVLAWALLAPCLFAALSGTLHFALSRKAFPAKGKARTNAAASPRSARAAAGPPRERGGDVSPLATRASPRLAKRRASAAASLV